MFRQREELEVKIAKKQRQAAALAALNDLSQETDQLLDLGLTGLTDACRSAFMAARNGNLTPVEVRDRLRQLQFPIYEYKNVLAAIHTVLKRLEKQGEIKKRIHDVHDGRDESVYEWLGRKR